MTAEIPGWGIPVIAVVLLAWSSGVRLLIEKPVLRYGVISAGGSTLRALAVTLLLHVTLVLWCIAVAMAVALARDNFGVATVPTTFVAVSGVGVAGPLVVLFVPTTQGLHPATEDLRRARATPAQVHAIQWVSLPFVIVEIGCLVAAPVAALLP